MLNAAPKPSRHVLRASDRRVEWDLHVEVEDTSGRPHIVPVRHPDRIEPDGVRDHPGGILGLVWVAVRLLKRIAVGRDVSNRAAERRIRRAVLGAFDEPHRSVVARLPWLDLLQIASQIEVAQRLAVDQARRDAERVLGTVARSTDDRSGIEDPSASVPKRTGDGTIVRNNADGTRTTLFELKVGDPIPGQLTGGKPVVFGVPSAEQEGVD